MSRTIPSVVVDLPRRPPRVAERTLPSGLRMLAVRKPGVPLIQIRLSLPFAGRGSRYVARAQLLAQTLLVGTRLRSAEELNEALESLGAHLSADVDPDRLMVAGSGLSANARGLLSLLAEVLADPAYRAVDVRRERDRLVHRIAIARSRPGVIAREALLRRLHGDHPYGRELPETEDVAAVEPAAVTSLHARRVAPQGALLVLVGDIAPGRALELAEEALSSWRSAGSPSIVRPPRPPEQGPVMLIDRPGAAQTNIRMAGPGLPRRDPGYAALDLGNTIFGGYFSSRLVANIREARGYTYSPRSGLEHRRAASRLVVDADVGTEVTAPALREIWYELGRISTEPVTAKELEDARHYIIGILALATSSQSGLATTVARLAADGIGADYLRTYPRDLGRVTAAEVLAAARRHLAPSGMVTVLVGDAARIRDEVAPLAEIAVAR